MHLHTRTPLAPSVACSFPEKPLDCHACVLLRCLLMPHAISQSLGTPWHRAQMASLSLAQGRHEVPGKLHAGILGRRQSLAISPRERLKGAAVCAKVAASGSPWCKWLVLVLSSSWDSFVLQKGRWWECLRGHFAEEGSRMGWCLLQCKSATEQERELYRNQHWVNGTQGVGLPKGARRHKPLPLSEPRVSRV